MSKCRSCGAEVTWATTDAGKGIPLDPEPRQDGNLVIVGDDHFGTPRVRLDRPDDNQGALFGPSERYVSHFVTCPDASEWRRQ